MNDVYIILIALETDNHPENYFKIDFLNKVILKSMYYMQCNHIK